MIDKKKMGKNSRVKGKAFEKKVEADLTRLGWLVVKFNKQVDLEKNELVTARAQFNPFFGRIVGEGSGFPDFICLRTDNCGGWRAELVESKINAKLDKEENDKIKWLKEKLGMRIVLAFPGERGLINYAEQ